MSSDETNEEMGSGRACVYLGWQRSDRSARRKLTRCAQRAEQKAGRELFPRDAQGGLRFTPQLLSDHLPHLLRSRFASKSRQVLAILDEIHTSLEERVTQNTREIRDLKRRVDDHDRELDQTVTILERQAETMAALGKAYGASE